MNVKDVLKTIEKTGGSPTNQLLVNEINRLGAIIENHIDDISWLLMQVCVISNDEYDRKLLPCHNAGCRIDRDYVLEILNKNTIKSREGNEERRNAGNIVTCRN